VASGCESGHGGRTFLETNIRREIKMSLDASKLLGSQQMAGTTVSPRGFGKKLMTGSADMYLGGAAGAAISAAGEKKGGRQQAQWAASSQTPTFGRFAYLASTDNEVALIKAKQGLVGLKLTEVVARVPRDAVSSIELGGGVTTCPLTISFENGDTWQLEVPRASKRGAEQLVGVLGG
jgi:hypothetical protein